MFGKIIAAVVIGAGIALVSGQADAAGPGSFARNFTVAGPVMAQAAKTGRIQACNIVRGQCAATAPVVPMAVAIERREELRQVSQAVNETFGALDDYFSELAGPSFPAVANAATCGDCAATKRLELISLGWQPDALRVAWSLSDNGDIDKVLMVETGAGTIVLENSRRPHLQAGELAL